MRKLLTILATLGLAVGISALSARADGVTYTVNSTYGSDVPVTSVSNPGSTFTFVFTVPSPCSSSSTPPCASSFGFVDFLSSIDVTFSSPTLAGFTSLASVSFAPSGSGGLFDIETVFGNGDDFLWMFFGPQVFNSTPGEICLGPAGTFCTGSFSITPGPADLSGSLFADLTNPNAPTAGVLTGGSVSTPAVTTPEPSSLLLLGSGFLALGGIARRRLIARFN
jgi:PEP-CTERM motif